MVETAAFADRPVAESVPPEPLMRQSSLATAVFVILLFVAAVVLLYAGRHLTFFFDEWTFIVLRRGHSVGTFLDPHNGHLVVFAVLVYKLLFALVGLHHYWPYRAVAVALHLVASVSLYILIRRRLGPWLALGPVALLLFMGSAWQLLLWPFQITFLTSAVGGLAALALLDDRGRRHDAWAAAALILSLSGSDVGLAFIAAAAVWLALVRASWRRYWIVALPAVLWLIWYAGWGTSQQVTGSSVLTAPEYVADAAAGAVAGIAGLSDAVWGPPLALGLVALVLVSWRRRLGAVLPVLLLSALAGALVFWGLAALARSSAPEPAASRYLYIGAIFIFLIAADARLGLGLRGGWLVAVGVLIAAAILGNIGLMRAGERSLRASDDSVRTSLGVIEIAQPTVSPAFIVDAVNAPQLTAGPTLAAMRSLGSPAYTVGELEHAGRSLQAEADVKLEAAEQLTAAHAGRAMPPGSSCGRDAAQLTVSPGLSLYVSATDAPVSIDLRRFAPSYTLPPLATVPPQRTDVIRFPEDGAPNVPWQVRLRSARPPLACVS